MKLSLAKNRRLQAEIQEKAQTLPPLALDLLGVDDIAADVAEDHIKEEIREWAELIMEEIAETAIDLYIDDTRKTR